MIDKITHKGGCHCGAVTFEVRAPSNIEAVGCNCSICSATGFIHHIVDKTNFTLLTGKNDITVYSFNTRQAKHIFCKYCGVKSFYHPRSHPNGISININCLNMETVTNIHYSDFDGQNWEKNIQKLHNTDKP
jgi:hypothetical protein